MERAVPILPVDDLGVAKQFYVGALGFDVAFEATEDGRTGLLGLQRGTIHKSVWQHDLRDWATDMKRSSAPGNGLL